MNRLDSSQFVGQNPRVTHFRPRIDLHRGQVKQIVGGSLSDDDATLQTNFVAEHTSSWYAALYRCDGWKGGHVIQLGPGNDQAARAALAAYPGGLQIGGGITPANAAGWIAAGASHVIVTSCLFDQQGCLRSDVLKELEAAVGVEKIVIDLSCRRTENGWTVAMNRWQTPTRLKLTPDALDALAEHCAEFLIHAADVEGLCGGIDEELVAMLGAWKGLPVTYAGGIRRLEDFQTIDSLSGGRVDATVGSALDLFGGNGVRYADVLAREGRA